MNGYPLRVSTHMPASQLLLGNFDDLLVVTFGALAVAADEYTNFSTGTVGIRGILPVDVGIKRPVSFVVAS